MRTDREILDKYDLTNQNVDVLKEIILCAMNEYADQFRKPEKKTIEERKEDFAYKVGETCREFNFADHKSNMEFIDYWTEHGENAKKMRFEKEKVFDIKKRLERWKRNNFNNGTIGKSNTTGVKQTGTNKIGTDYDVPL